MTKRGTKPTPKALRLVRGGRKDRVNRSEPTPAPSAVVAPKSLSKPGRIVWDERAPDMVARKVLTAWDVDEFAAWCEAVASARTAIKMVRLEGELIERPVFDRNGKQTGSRVVRNEWWDVWRDAVDRIDRFGAKYGLTPSDRTRLSVGHEDSSAKPGDDLLTGGA